MSSVRTAACTPRMTGGLRYTQIKRLGIKGQHVLIKEDGTVIGGLGGKLNGMKLSKVKFS